MTGAWVGPAAVALLQASFTRPPVSAFAFTCPGDTINARPATVTNVVNASRANLVAHHAVVAFITALAGIRDRVDEELLRAHTDPRKEACTRMRSTTDKLGPRQRTGVFTHVTCPLRSTRTEAIAEGPVVTYAVTAAWCADTTDAWFVTALSKPTVFAVGAHASCIIVVPVTI